MRNVYIDQVMLQFLSADITMVSHNPTFLKLFPDAIIYDEVGNNKKNLNRLIDSIKSKCKTTDKCIVAWLKNTDHSLAGQIVILEATSEKIKWNKPLEIDLKQIGRIDGPLFLFQYDEPDTIIDDFLKKRRQSEIGRTLDTYDYISCVHVSDYSLIPKTYEQITSTETLMEIIHGFNEDCLPPEPIGQDTFVLDMSTISQLETNSFKLFENWLRRGRLMGYRFTFIVASEAEMDAIPIPYSFCIFVSTNGYLVSLN